MTEFRQYEVAWVEQLQAELGKSIGRETELEAELAEARAEVDHFHKLAMVDIGANPPVSWKKHAQEMERQLAEARALAEDRGEAIRAALVILPTMREPQDGLQKLVNLAVGLLTSDDLALSSPSRTAGRSARVGKARARTVVF